VQVVGIPGQSKFHSGGMVFDGQPSGAESALSECRPVARNHKTRTASPPKFWNAPTLSRGTRRFTSGTLPMPTVARHRRAVSGPLAIRSTILAALRRWTIATRMRALVGFLFGHDPPPYPCSLSYAHIQERNGCTFTQKALRSDCRSYRRAAAEENLRVYLGRCPLA
jgi:hypothetical protein